MIWRAGSDDDVVRRWTNAPLLVRDDPNQLLRASDLSPTGDPAHYVAWDAGEASPAAYDSGRGRHAVDEARLALFGTYDVITSSGPVTCRPVFDLLAEECRRMDPSVAAEVTGVAAADIEETASSTR
jgi:anaerobic selenocysteine-containing dehydrogenase